MRHTLAVAFTVLLVAVTALPVGAAEATIPFQVQDARIHAPADGEALTSASQAVPENVVEQYLAQRLAPTETLKTKDQFFSETAGVTHVRMTQEIDGLEVYGSYVKAAVNEFGELVWMAETVADVPANGLVTAKIGAQRALETALRELHPDLGDFTRVDLRGNTTVFAGDAGFWRPPTVTRVAVPMDDGSLQEGFLVETWTDEDNLLHHTLVSGAGQILRIELRTNTDSYNIFPDHPGNSSQTIVAGPGTGNAESPIGWLDPVNHSSIFITGNNTRTYLDTDANNSPDSGGVTISDGNFVTVADLSQEPETSGNQEAAVQNLFYYCNTIHDKLYSHGFIESTGNFQQDNFGNGGNGGDPVLCEAQDGSGTNNANFSTPSDGSSGRMQMFVWTQTSPKRDGDLDSDIIWHEYGHGLTWRMIGSMSGAMSGAIGEGNSDVLSLLANGNDVVGEYSFNNVNGIRSEPYEGYSRTYGDFEGSSVHFDGEIYAAIHWDLMGRYAANGFTVDDHWSDMVGGMNFTPSGPDFEAMRDGMLAQAPSTRDCLIWESFAKFGVGVNATNDISCNFFGCSGSITEDFTIPSECENVDNPPTVTITAPADGSTFDEGTSVSFSGSASDTEDGDLTANLVWNSDLDGQIGTGGSFSTSTLSLGTHTITASVTDSAGQTGSDSITVTIVDPTVDNPPTVTITAPADGSSFDEGTSVSFSGSASDTEDGDLTAGLVWNSDLDGQIGTGGSFSTSTLSLGTHTITASVTDSAGQTGSDSITVTINEVSADPITLSTNGRKVRGRHNIDLSWSGATSTNVDVYRNGSLIATTPNDGAFTDSTNNRGGATYEHQVCEAGSTTACSNIATTTF